MHWWLLTIWSTHTKFVFQSCNVIKCFRSTSEIYQYLCIPWENLKKWRLYAQISTIAHCGQVSTCESIRQIAKIQKHCLRIVLDDYDSDYDDVLLRKSGKATMEIKWLKVLTIEIFKTVINLNPNYIKIPSHQNYIQM